VLGAVSRGLIRHPDLPEWIQKRTLLKFDTRTIYRAGDKPVLGLVCETRVKNLIIGSCEELLALGISPLDRYVQVGCCRFRGRRVKLTASSFRTP
jgi:hypothetical protein